MLTKYRLLPKAAADFFDIHAYSAENFGDEQAERYTNGLLDAFTVITDHSHIGRSVSHIRAGYFCYEYKRHSIFYRLEEHGVIIIRVLGSQQNAPKHL